MISDSPRWTDRLRHLVMRAAVPVKATYVRDTRFWLILGGESEHDSLAVWIAPVVNAEQSWKVLRNCCLGYEAKGRPTGWQIQALKVIYRVVAHLDASIPARFEPTVPFVQGELTDAEFHRVLPFVTAERSEQDGIESTEILLRVTSRCCQHCPFCSAPEFSDPSPEDVELALRIARRRWQGATISITGGEPTFYIGLNELVARLVLDDAWSCVQIQTNAVHYAKPASPLPPPSPRLTFFVSLHALDEAIYDTSTGSTGQMPLAVAGIRRLLESGHQVIVNCVVSAMNVGHLYNYVERLNEAFPQSPRLQLHFSSLIVVDHRPMSAECLVQYSDLAPALQAATDHARDLELNVQPLRSSTHASLPPCLLPLGERGANSRRPRPTAEETGYEDFALPWVKANTCRNCSETGNCLGVPREYGNRFGLGELGAGIHSAGHSSPVRVS